MDIYSMGIVFYQIATLLNYPYKILKGSEDEYRNAHLYGSVINPRNYNRNIEFNIETTILKMLEKEPKKSFVRKVADKLLPIGTGRREFVKKLIGKGKKRG